MNSRLNAYQQATLVFKDKITEIRDMAGQLKKLEQAGFIKSEQAAPIQEQALAVIDRVLALTNVDPATFKAQEHISSSEMSKLLVLTYNLGRANGALRELVVHGETVKALAKASGIQ